MICEAMGTAETLVGAAVNSQLGQQVREYLPRFVAIDTSWFQGGQLAQSSFNQFQNNPNQFVQSQFSQNGPLVAAATAVAAAARTPQAAVRCSLSIGGDATR